MMKRIVTFAVLLLTCTRVQAGTEGYVCTISSYSVLRDDGKLDYRPDDPIVGKEFTVDRASGKVIGRYLSSEWLNPQVLQKGSVTETFKVLARNPYGPPRVLYLEIKEFSKSAQKPFLLMRDAVVYSGLCT